MRVAIVAEYYPRAADPVLGVWAHRQALAARDAGADVRVLVLHRPVPSRAAVARGGAITLASSTGVSACEPYEYPRQGESDIVLANSSARVARAPTRPRRGS